MHTTGEIHRPYNLSLNAMAQRKLLAFLNRTEYDRDPTAHAEMICIREATRSLEQWRLLVNTS